VVTYDDQAIDVFMAPEHFEAVKEALTTAGLTPDIAEISMVPATKAALDGDLATKMHKLIDMLEDLDDVQNVYTNLDE
jgi:transcriptional/translational regulatory protein YebC/TACO1